MQKPIVVRGRLTGPTHIELEQPVNDVTGEVEVVLRVIQPAGAAEQQDVVEFLRSLPPGTRSKEDIYAVEGVPLMRTRAIDLIESAPSGQLVTSRLARLECRVKPLRDGDAGLLAIYDGFFSRVRVSIVDVTPAVLDRATEIRARFGFKVPDAIHLASAVEAGAQCLRYGRRCARALSWNALRDGTAVDSGPSCPRPPAQWNQFVPAFLRASSSFAS